MNRDNRPLPLSPNLREIDSEVKTTIRFQFSRKGALIYIAHLDMLRLFERALVRSGLSFCSSQGFNPRPMMVFALPVGVGVAVERDYVDIVFSGKMDPAYAVERLNASFPEDLRLVSAAVVLSSGKSLMAVVRRAEYIFIHEKISSIVEAALIADVLPVRKITGGKEKTIDICPLIIEICHESESRIRAVFSAGSKDNLRPDLFLKAFIREDRFTVNDMLDTEIIRTCVYLDQGNQETTK